MRAQVIFIRIDCVVNVISFDFIGPFLYPNFPLSIFNADSSSLRLLFAVFNNPLPRRSDAPPEFAPEGLR